MERKLNWRLSPVAVLLCCWLSVPAIGQDCRITGRITDADGSALATAIVTATHLESGFERQVLSNAQGSFQLAPLPAGQYRIDAVKPGFKPLSRTGVDLAAGLNHAVDLHMEAAAVSETISLEARKVGAGFLLAYVCGLSRSSGCEMLTPILEPAMSGIQTDFPLLP
jgi:hypothetical protein